MIKEQEKSSKVHLAQAHTKYQKLELQTLWVLDEISSKLGNAGDGDGGNDDDNAEVTEMEMECRLRKNSSIFVGQGFYYFGF